MNTLWEQMFDNIKKTQRTSKWNELKDPEAVYHHLHGNNGELTPDSQLAGPRKWVKGYTSKRCATVDAEGMVKVYYDRCCQIENVDFIIGSPVARLLHDSHSTVAGVVLRDGRELRAQKTILATGAWSSSLVKLDQKIHANAVGIAYIKLSPEEYENYKDIPCHTNLITGINIFTPLRGYLKILRRTNGIRNTTTLKDPEDPTKTYQASYPLTQYDEPTQTLSADMEQSLRDEMKEILPQFANHPFAKTKFCWYVSNLHSKLQRTRLKKAAGSSKPQTANSSSALIPNSQISTLQREVRCMGGNSSPYLGNSWWTRSVVSSMRCSLRSGLGSPRPMPERISLGS